MYSDCRCEGGDAAEERGPIKQERERERERERESPVRHAHGEGEEAHLCIAGVDINTGGLRILARLSLYLNPGKMS